MSTIAVKTDPTIDARRVFGRAALLTLAAAVLLGCLGYLPTQNLAGTAGLAAMCLALALTSAATLTSLLIPLRKLHAPPLERHNALLGAMLARFVITGLLTLAAALAHLAPLPPLLLWVAIAYMALLAVDTIVLTGVLKEADRNADQ